jgi:hypothetical protein
MLALQLVAENRERDPKERIRLALVYLIIIEHTIYRAHLAAAGK